MLKYCLVLILSQRVGVIVSIHYVGLDLNVS